MPAVACCGKSSAVLQSTLLYLANFDAAQETMQGTLAYPEWLDYGKDEGVQ